jgi:hypothetical protein
VTVWGSPRNPGSFRVGTACDVFGDVRASSTGTAVPPNASANTFGNWTAIGSATTSEYFYFYINGHGPSNINWNGRGGSVEMSFDNSTACTPAYHYTLSTSEVFYGPDPQPMIWRKNVPGDTLYLRAKDHSTSGQSPQFIIHAVR